MYTSCLLARIDQRIETRLVLVVLVVAWEWGES